MVKIYKYRMVLGVGGEQKTEAIMSSSRKELKKKAKQISNHSEGRCQIFSVVYINGDINMPDIKYRGFDICDLGHAFWLVKTGCSIFNYESYELQDSEENILKYIDDYYYDQNNGG